MGLFDKLFGKNEKKPAAQPTAAPDEKDLIRVLDKYGREVQITSVRLLLAETLLAMKRVRPEIMGEFKQQVADLQREHPLSEPAQGIVQKMIAEALSPSTPTGA